MLRMTNLYRTIQKPFMLGMVFVWYDTNVAPVLCKVEQVLTEPELTVLKRYLKREGKIEELEDLMYS
jgi:hypothetical protein